MSKGLKVALRKIGGGKMDSIKKLERLMVFMCVNTREKMFFDNMEIILGHL